MRFEIIDSHRNMSGRNLKALGRFLKEVKELSDDMVEKQVNFCNWYEKTYGVKCFESVAYCGNRIAGFMRCYRHPSDPKRWFSGDVHVAKRYRRRGIATGMYENAIREITEYESSQTIIATIASTNTASAALHKKLGFVDTKVLGEFGDFIFKPDETFYELKLYRRFPVESHEWSKTSLKSVWLRFRRGRGSYASEADIQSELEQLICDVIDNRKYDMETIWYDGKLVGFAYWNATEELEFIVEDSAAEINN